MSAPPAELRPVVYAEDDENDAFLIRYCWNQAAIPHPLEIVPDGQRAIAYLAATAALSRAGGRPAPSLLLLDLNLPRPSGLEVLAWVRAQPPFSTLPVAMLSSSNQQQDIDRARALGATEYFVKPGNVMQLSRLVNAIRDRWLHAAA